MLGSFSLFLKSRWLRHSHNRLERTKCSSYAASVSTVPLCPRYLCAHCSSVLTVPLCSLFLCAHCSSVPTVPLCPLFLCAHCSSVLTVPLCSLFLCAHCSSVPTFPLCLLGSSLIFIIIINYMRNDSVSPFFV